MFPSRTLAIILIVLVIAGLACSSSTGTPTLVPPTQAADTPTPIPPTHTPAPTRRPTATRPPTATPLPEGVWLTQDFSSQEAAEDQGWSFEAGESVERAWSSNKFTFIINKTQWLGLNWPDGEYDDFAAEIEAQAQSSFAEYGIIFRISGAQDARSYYLFGVTTEGKYYLDKLVDGEWADTTPIKTTASQYVKKGKVKNALGVLAEGSQLSLYINGFLVKTIEDDSIASGMVGLYAGSGSADSAEVDFTAFSVLAPEKAKEEWGAAPAQGGSEQPTATTAPSGGGGSGGTGNGLIIVSNSFPGACQANLWGQKEAVIRAEGNSSASQWLPPGLYGAHLAVDIGEVDLSYQINLPAGGRCTIICDASTKSVYVSPSSCRR